VRRAPGIDVNQLLVDGVSKRLRKALVAGCLGTVLVSPLAGRDQVSGSAESRFRIVRSLIDAGRWAQAEAEAESLLATLEGPQAATSPNIEQALDLLVEALLCNGRGAEPRTRELAERAIRSRETRVGPSHPTLASSRRNLGDVFIQSGEYQLARPEYETALRIRRTALGDNHPDVADDLDHLARVLAFIEKYDDALAASGEALAIKERTLDSTDIRLARSLDVRGLLLQRRGSYAASRPPLERALAVRERNATIHPETAVTLSLMGEQLRYEGNLVPSTQFTRRALAVAEETLRPDHPDIASYLRILAIPTIELGDLAGGRALRQRALAIAEKSLGSDHPEVAIQLNDLGLSLLRDGDYSAARAMLERAQHIYERRFGSDYIGVTTEVFNLAIVSNSLGDYREARRLFNRAITTWQRVNGPDYPYLALALSELATVLTEQGLDADATAAYQRALAIQERTLGKNHRDVARTLAQLSANLATRGRFDQALESASRALAILEQTGERETRRAAYVLTVTGTLRAELGEYDAARTSFDRALTILRQVVGPTHPDVADVQVPLAAALAGVRDTSGALADALAAERIGRDHLQLMLRSLPERQGLEYASSRPKGLDFALTLSAAGAGGEDTTRVVDSLIRSRGLVLDEMARRRHASADATRPDLAPSWAALVSARQRYANLVIRGGDEQHPDRFPALLEAARREKEDAERAFADKSVAFGRDLSHVESGLDEVYAALPANAALVSFVRYDRSVVEPAGPPPSTSTRSRAARSRKAVPSYLACVLRSEQPQPWVVPLGSASAIDALVARWHDETSPLSQGRLPAEAEPAYRSAGAALRRRTWDPLREYLTGASTVFVVPDGALNLVSFAALPVGEKRYLIETGPLIHYLSAERDLVPPDGTPKAGRGLLAVGGPAFNDGTVFVGPSRQGSPAVPARRDAARKPAGGSRSGAADGDCETLQSLRFPALDASRMEVRDVAQLWTDAPAEILENRLATERAFKREAPGHLVLHLATHGFFVGSDCVPSNGRSVAGTATGGTGRTTQSTQLGRSLQPALKMNPLVRSGLALAGANRRTSAGPDEDDGILTAEEVSALNLEGVEWAVLSACDTGLGEVKAGEGVFGLRRAFQVAGVRTVIMSLWSVDDDATRLWMRALYQSRLQQHLTTVESVRAASLTILRDRRARKQDTHPFYWAAFVAAGDWR
jgi:CHAT domain-containing protein/tetratricopeptide (TPR) repeat protein